METTSGSRNMLENVSPSVLVLLFLTTLIAGGIIFLIRYAVNRRSRSSLEQDSSKNLECNPSWSPTAPPLRFIPIPQEPPCYSHSFRNGRRISLNKKRNKQVLLFPTHSWLTTMLRGHTGTISNMNFSNNGRYLASCADDWSLQPGEHVQSHYRPRSQTETNVTSILPSPHSNVMSPSRIYYNRYQHGNQERNPEMRGQVTIDNAYRRNNSGGKLWPPTYFSVENTDIDVNREMQQQHEQAVYVSNLYYDDYKSERQNIPLNDSSLWQAIEIYKLTSSDLTERGYPVESPDFPGCAMIKNITYPSSPNFTRNFIANTAEEKNDKKDSDSGNCSSSSTDSASEQEQESSSDKRIGGEKKSDSKKKCDVLSHRRKRECVRCHKSFYIDYSGKYVSMQRCVYHWGKLFDRRINGEVNCKYWTCCKNSEFSPGCETGVHVWNGLMPGQNGPFTGYVRTLPSNQRMRDNNYGIYAIDCEMCYTIYGLELTKVTVIDLFGNLVYDTLVKPKTKIIDYNTRFSGITEEQMLNVTMTLEQVQEELITFIHAETILLGHNLASDFRMLHLFHENVVDTTMMFPHDYGFPYCMGLKTLARKVLRWNIQENTHDSIEDARVVVDLVLRKVHYDVTSAMEKFT
ncbi:uncharacterized protein [Polyergus mexicanus]|uniref:uncharacterized protein isoform X1 n=1 Tax=Polyergus mexicanus TaxID=615972 RepID=UPI0038B4BE57